MMANAGRPARIGLAVLLVAAGVIVNGVSQAAGALGDYNGDSASDLAVYGEAAGAWYVHSLAVGMVMWGAVWGGSGFSAVPGDYDGDGRDDLAVYDRVGGNWYIGSLTSGVIAWSFPWGGASWVPAPGDYDGDGRADLAVYGTSDGAWFLASLTGGVIAAAAAWGGPGFSAVPGDYDGDARADLAVYGAGAWYVRSVEGHVLRWAVPWGGTGLAPVAGDYNGDGRSDLAVYHAGSGAWYIAATGQSVLAWAEPWGGPQFAPVPGDYDGDGVSDLAVYHEATGAWFIRSLAGPVQVWGTAWGGPGLMPVPLSATNAGAFLADLGTNGSFHGRRFFPDDNPWNQRVDLEPVDPNSDILIAGIGANTAFHPDFGANWNGGPFGMPYLVVPGTEALVRITYTDYGDESDPGPFPIPISAPVEPGSDRHVLVVDRDHWMLYELYNAWPVAGGWEASSGARFDLASNALRPEGWTSADAAGLPILPGLVRYDEVYEQGEIRHALRFTCYPTRRAYVYPARHYASSDTSPNLPPMGMRVRLKASVDISGFPPAAQVILRCLKTYGMILADNGSDWYVSGTADARWNDEDMNTLKALRGSDFEVVRMGEIVVGQAP
jgi:hypothetical protein